MTVSTYSYASAARCLQAALTLGDRKGWDGFSLILAARLSTAETVAIAVSALRTLPDPCLNSLSDALPARLNASASTMDEAKSWTTTATRNELKAFCLACFQALPAQDQSAFLSYVHRKDAA